MVYPTQYLEPVLFVFIAGMAVRRVYLTVMPPRRASKVPACEKCRYPVAGLAGMMCPECGTDLRETGIITMQMEMRRRASGLWGTLFCWTLIVLIFGGLAMNFALRNFGRDVLFRTMPVAAVTTKYWMAPTAGGYEGVEVVVTDWDNGRRSIALNLVQTGRASSTLTIHVNTPNLSVLLPDGEWIQLSQPMSAADIEPLMTKAELDMAKEERTRELEELVTFVESAFLGRAFSFSGTSFVVGEPVVTQAVISTSAKIWALAPIVGTGLGVLGAYGFGAYFIVVRRRRMMEGTGPKKQR